MGKSKEREPLARAIVVRDEVRADRDEADRRLDECLGKDDYGIREKHWASREAVAKASERVDALKRERDELESPRTYSYPAYSGAVGGTFTLPYDSGLDQIKVHRHFIETHGDTADVVIGAAEEALQSAARQHALLSVEKTRLEIIQAAAEDALSSAERTVGSEVSKLVLAQAAEAISALWTATNAALSKASSLAVIMEGVNLQHHSLASPSHPLHDARSLLFYYERFLSSTAVQEDIDRLLIPTKAGAAPWRAAIEKLKTDAYAELPKP